MLIDGEWYLSAERVMELFDLNDRTSLYITPWKERLKSSYALGCYNQKKVHAMLKDIEKREKFHCSIQSLVMFIIDEAPKRREFDTIKNGKKKPCTKGDISNLLGFGNIGNMDSFLGTISGKQDGMTLVKACFNYRSIVNLYDKEYS